MEPSITITKLLLANGRHFMPRILKADHGLIEGFLVVLKKLTACLFLNLVEMREMALTSTRLFVNNFTVLLELSK
jgi:hypothetical protein